MHLVLVGPWCWAMAVLQEPSRRLLFLLSGGRQSAKPLGLASGGVGIVRLGTLTSNWMARSRGDSSLPTEYDRGKGQKHLVCCSWDAAVGFSTYCTTPHSILCWGDCYVCSDCRLGGLYADGTQGQPAVADKRRLSSAQLRSWCYIGELCLFWWGCASGKPLHGAVLDSDGAGLAVCLRLTTSECTLGMS
jgi:hypothetical protein